MAIEKEIEDTLKKSTLMRNSTRPVLTDAASNVADGISITKGSFEPLDDAPNNKANLKPFPEVFATTRLAPRVSNVDLYYGYINKELSGSIEIIGFINIPDFVTPETVSRHIVALNEKAESEPKNSFLYLLHTSLKLENMAAIVKLSSDCYGAINCGSDGKVDTKKKSYLTLAIFKPDFYTIEAILSKVPQLEPKVAASPSKTQITQRPQPNKSYAKGCIVWYRAVNLQSDIQKIFRNAKKMHEKMPIFYKELNRVRKAALTFGFYELFQGLSKMFERELINSASSYNADSTAQLTHVIRCLNSPEYKDFRKDIQPWISQTPQSKGHKK
ncbi:unnamed protein product [Brachionus calyciflorus]|uniref:Uncharacterized protein n=1 Tax=Brachionus calyciflorus TaxID=104777 RepID=A0A813X066_9BILA|nr:unnamed protein product [Brachionus calyciflorus]